MFIHEKKLYMDHSGFPPEIFLKQYDSDFAVKFELDNIQGTFTMESGTTAKIRGTKSDGKGYSVNASVDINNKSVTAQGDIQMTAVAGRMPFELSLTKGSKVLNTVTFYLNIEKAALADDSIISDSEITDFRQAVNASAETVEFKNQAAGYAQEANTAKTEASASAASAAQSAKDAAAVFALAGDVSFVILENRKVRMYFAESE